MAVITIINTLIFISNSFLRFISIRVYAVHLFFELPHSLFNICLFQTRSAALRSRSSQSSFTIS
jgi:hypothetical protein